MAGKRSQGVGWKRGPGRRFVKGQSGNPKGRAKGLLNKVTREIREFARSVLEQPIYQRRLRKMFSDQKPEEIPGHFVTLLYHYAYGKPKETVEHLGVGGGPVRFTLVIGGQDGHSPGGA